MGERRRLNLLTTTSWANESPGLGVAEYRNEEVFKETSRANEMANEPHKTLMSERENQPEN